MSVEPGLRRFGDQGAPRPQWQRGKIVLSCVLFALAALALIFSIANGYQRNNLPQALGSSVGLALAVGIVVAALWLWRFYWRSTFDAVRAAEATPAHPLALAARVPVLAPEIIAKHWPEGSAEVSGELRVVLTFDDFGVCMTPSHISQPLFSWPWRSIQNVILAEYVENDYASEGLAIELVGSKGAVVVQPVTLRGPFVSFPKGRRLRTLVDEITERMASARLRSPTGPDPEQGS